MKAHYKGRFCKGFHCERRGGPVCCRDCYLLANSRCSKACHNDPARCGMEDTGYRQRMREKLRPGERSYHG